MEVGESGFPPTFSLCICIYEGCVYIIFLDRLESKVADSMLAYP